MKIVFQSASQATNTGAYFYLLIKFQGNHYQSINYSMYTTNSSPFTNAQWLFLLPVVDLVQEAREYLPLQAYLILSCA